MTFKIPIITDFISQASTVAFNSMKTTVTAASDILTEDTKIFTKQQSQAFYEYCVANRADWQDKVDGNAISLIKYLANLAERSFPATGLAEKIAKAELISFTNNLAINCVAILPAEIVKGFDYIYTELEDLNSQVQKM